MTYIKDWFLVKNFNQNELHIINEAMILDELEQIGETEKAIKFVAHSDFGNLYFWCPKSCIYTAEELKEKAKKINNGLKYNESLVKLAKENGIKGIRTGMKTATLISKLREAGIEIPARA